MWNKAWQQLLCARPYLWSKKLAFQQAVEESWIMMSLGTKTEHKKCSLINNRHLQPIQKKTQLKIINYFSWLTWWHWNLCCTSVLTSMNLTVHSWSGWGSYWCWSPWSPLGGRSSAETNRHNSVGDCLCVAQFRTETDWVVSLFSMEIE